MRSAITGSTGTTRCLLPLPVIISAPVFSRPVSGASLRFKLSASEIRSPQPYMRVKTARSLAASQSLSCVLNTASRAFSASASESGLGIAVGSFGVFTARMAALAARPRRSRKRKKLRSDDSARAVELRETPAPARLAR